MRLYSRPGNDLTHRFPLIVEAVAKLRSRSCIIDGEAVACGDDGVASFNRIRYRHHDADVFLYAFDCVLRQPAKERTFAAVPSYAQRTDAERGGSETGGIQMRECTRIILYAGLFGATVAGGVAASGDPSQADDLNSAPNPYHIVNNWAKLPQGRVWGMAMGVDIDRDGTSVWVFDRCGGKSCDGSNVAPIQKFDAAGRLVVSFGSGLFSWPHGLFAAPDGTVWVTDGKNQTVMEFAPDGQVLRISASSVSPAPVPTHSIRPPTSSSRPMATFLSPTVMVIIQCRRRSVHRSSDRYLSLEIGSVTRQADTCSTTG